MAARLDTGARPIFECRWMPIIHDRPCKHRSKLLLSIWFTTSRCIDVRQDWYQMFYPEGMKVLVSSAQSIDWQLTQTECWDFVYIILKNMGNRHSPDLPTSSSDLPSWHWKIRSGCSIKFWRRIYDAHEKKTCLKKAEWPVKKKRKSLHNSIHIPFSRPSLFWR